MMTGNRIEVETTGWLNTEDRIPIMDDYEEAFQKNAHFNPCRQYYHRKELRAALVNHCYQKIIGRLNGEVVFLVLATREFGELTWIEPAFYDHHWPELKNHRMYISAIYIRQDKKGSLSLFRRLIKSITDYMTANQIKAVFYDHGGSGPIQSLTNAVGMITGARVLQPSGAQVYGGFLYEP